MSGFTPKPAVPGEQCAILLATSIAPFHTGLSTTGNCIEVGAHSVAPLTLGEPQHPPPLEPVGGLGDARAASAMTSLAALERCLRKQNRERLSAVNDEKKTSR